MRHKQQTTGRKGAMKMKYDVINLLGEILATFDSEMAAHDYADTLKNYSYVEATE